MHMYIYIYIMPIDLQTEVAPHRRKYALGTARAGRPDGDERDYERERENTNSGISINK